MSGWCPDGSYIPSCVNSVTDTQLRSIHRTVTSADFAIREGWVVAKHISDKDVSYEVLIDKVSEQCGGATTIRLQKCFLSESAGSNVDQAHTSIRCPVNWELDKITNELKQQSTRVVVAFINGLSTHGLIIGMLPNNGEPVTKELGHNSFHSFNGIETRINKDGEYVLTFTGQTIDDQNKVQPKDDAKAGTFLKLTKEGNIVLSDTRGEVLTIDNTNKKVTLEARAQETNITDGNWKLEVKGDVKIHATGNVSVDSDKKVFIGGESAKENLMLGKKTLNALKLLINTFTDAPIIGNLGSPNGPPVTLNPIIKTMLQQWKLQNCVPATSPLLAKKKFTE